MTNAPARGVACSACGGPLAPAGNAVRVTCGYCKTVNDVASAGALQVAQKLDQLGIRVPERPMTIEQIEEDIARRDRAQRDARRTGLIVAGVVVGIVMLLSLALVLLVR